MAKSEMVLVSAVGNILILADIFCCRVGSLPMAYLGMPLGGGDGFILFLVAKLSFSFESRA